VPNAWVSIPNPPGCIIQPGATVVNYVHTSKITQSKMLDIPLIVILHVVAHEQVHNNGCGPLPQKGWMPVAKQPLHACTDT